MLFMEMCSSCFPRVSQRVPENTSVQMDVVQGHAVPSSAVSLLVVVVSLCLSLLQSHVVGFVFLRIRLR